MAPTKAPTQPLMFNATASVALRLFTLDHFACSLLSPKCSRGRQTPPTLKVSTPTPTTATTSRITTTTTRMKTTNGCACHITTICRLMLLSFCLSFSIFRYFAGNCQISLSSHIRRLGRLFVISISTVLFRQYTDGRCYCALSIDARRTCVRLDCM